MFVTGNGILVVEPAEAPGMACSSQFVDPKRCELKMMNKDVIDRLLA